MSESEPLAVHEIEEELEGVIVSLRKSSRKMCFATLCSKSLQATSREHAEDFGEKDSLVCKCQLLLYHDEGWKQMVKGDVSLCCGAVVRCSGVFESQEQDGMKQEPRLQSLLVRRLIVLDSPHRGMSESGGVRQHPMVERIAREGHMRSCNVQPLCKQVPPALVSCV